VPSTTQASLYFRIKANSLHLFRTAGRLRGDDENFYSDKTLFSMDSQRERGWQDRFLG